MQERCKQFGSHEAKKRLFSVGYMKGSMKVSIRIPADMSDVGQHVSRGENVIMWCEGLSTVMVVTVKKKFITDAERGRKCLPLKRRINVLKKWSEIFARSTTIGTLQFSTDCGQK